MSIKDFIKKSGVNTDGIVGLETKTSSKDLADAVLDHYKTTIFNISSIASDRIQNYLPKKFERRINSDYIGNDKKLKDIYKKITNVDEAFKKAEKELRSFVG